MKLITREWIGKAEGDFSTVCRELRARRNPNYDAACFHAQQCCEKYLKARLVEAGIEFHKIHDLTLLLDQALSSEPEWESSREDLAFLTQFGVVFRYPGDSADKAMAADAQQRCVRFRALVRKSFRLP